MKVIANLRPWAALRAVASEMESLEDLFKMLEGEGFEVVTRYGEGADALPDPGGMCPGQCEGMGCVPIQFTDRLPPDPDRLGVSWSPEEVAQWRPLWDEAEAKEHSEDGWHFLTCPECHGSGKRISTMSPEKEDIMEAIGEAASIHWPKSKEVFDSTRAIEIADGLAEKLGINALQETVRKMDDALFAQRRRVIDILYDAKSVLGGMDLPRLKVRIVDYDETGTLGLCHIGKDHITVSGKIVDWDEDKLRHIVWHELAHAWFGAKHDAADPLMGPTYKAFPREVLEQSLRKAAGIRAALYAVRAGRKTIVFDFDGTVCEEREFPEIGPPIWETIERMRAAKDAGIEVVIQSCRWSEHELSTPESAAENLVIAKAWLEANDVPYDRMVGGKPLAEMYFDDKACHANDLQALDRLIIELASGYPVDGSLRGVSAEAVKFFIGPNGEFESWKAPIDFDPKDPIDWQDDYSSGAKGHDEVAQAAIAKETQRGEKDANSRFWGTHARGTYHSGVLYLDFGFEKSEMSVEKYLGNVPGEFSFPKSLVIQVGPESIEVPVLEGEDALDAWKHRKDIRHRVKASATSNFWLSPDGKLYPSPKEHADSIHDISPEISKMVDEEPVPGRFTVEIAMDEGWSRIIKEHGRLSVDLAPDKDAEWALSVLPPEFLFCKTLYVDTQNMARKKMDEEIPVLEGEDALDAWKHRKDIRHRVAAGLRVRGEALDVVGYHGTRVIDKIFKDVGGAGEDYYIATAESDGEWYAMEWKWAVTDGTPAVIRGRLTLKNYILVDHQNDEVIFDGNGQGLDEWMQSIGLSEDILDNQEYITAYAANRGYDGVVFSPGFSASSAGDDIAVFNSNGFKEEDVKLGFPGGADWTPYMSFAEAEQVLKDEAGSKVAASKAFKLSSGHPVDGALRAVKTGVRFWISPDGKLHDWESDTADYPWDEAGETSHGVMLLDLFPGFDKAGDFNDLPAEAISEGFTRGGFVSGELFLEMGAGKSVEWALSKLPPAYLFAKTLTVEGQHDEIPVLEGEDALDAWKHRKDVRHRVKAGKGYFKFWFNIKTGELIQTDIHEAEERVMSKYDYEEDDPWGGVQMAMEDGWARGYTAANEIGLTVASKYAGKIESILSRLPSESLFVKTLFVDFDRFSPMEGMASKSDDSFDEPIQGIPVLEGEDALDAWRHRKDVRHRVRASSNPIKFWVEEDGTVHLFAIGEEHGNRPEILDRYADQGQDYDEDERLTMAMEDGWVRGYLDVHPQRTLYMNSLSEKDISGALEAIPQEYKFCEELLVEIGPWKGQHKDATIPVLEGEDALDAWRHRKDVRHRVRAASKWYRADTGYRHPRGTTAADVLAYEEVELGNKYDIPADVRKNLGTIPADRLVWATRRPEDAEGYGQVSEITFKDPLVVAEDGDGGYLILEQAGPLRTMANRKDVRHGMQASFKVRAFGDNHEWGCLMLEAPDDLAKKVLAWGKENVPEDALFIDPEKPKDYGRETQIHTTVSYGIDPKTDPKEIEAAAMASGRPVRVKLGKVSKFEKKEDGYDVVKIEVESDDLRALHDTIEEGVGTPGNTYKDYKPHMTIAYVKPGSCDGLLGQEPFKGRELELGTFDYGYPPGKGEKDRHLAFESPMAAIAASLRVKADRVKAAKFDDLRKAALALIEDDPAWKSLIKDPVSAQAYGRMQQALRDARSEEDLKAAWEAHMDMPWEAVSAEAGGRKKP